MNDMSLGTCMRQSRLQRDLSLGEVARRAHVNKGYLSQLERDERDNPSEAVLRAVGDVLGLDLVTYAKRSAHAGKSDRDVALVFETQPDGSVIIVQMDRRAFLATAGTAGVAAIAPLPEPVTSSTVTALSDRLDHHVAASRVMPTDVVTERMTGDLAEIARVARQAPPRMRNSLLSLGSRYAEHLGWMRQDAGDVDGAMHWTNEAADLALAAGWRQMVAHTYTRKSFIMLDQRADFAADLARVARDRRWSASPTFMARAAAHEAEAHATAGDIQATEAALDLARTMADKAHPDDHMPAPQMVDAATLLDIMTARCRLALGQPDKALAILAPLASEWTTPRSMALYGSSLALAYAQVGDVDSACQVARGVAHDGQRSASVLARTRLCKVSTALRPWAGRPDVDQVITALRA